MDTHLRRRIAFATVLTMVGVPAYLALGRDAAGSSVDVVIESADQGAADSITASTAVFAVPSTGLPTPVFLDNTAVYVPPAVIDVVRPEPTTGNLVQGKATFRRYNAEPEAGRCTTGFARERATLTVTNIANGLSVTCRNVFGVRLPAGVDLVLDTDLFTKIANLSDAPVFVRITW